MKKDLRYMPLLLLFLLALPAQVATSHAARADSAASANQADAKVTTVFLGISAEMLMTSYRLVRLTPIKFRTVS